MTVSIKPNGQTKQLAGKSASGYDVEISVPGILGGPKGPPVTATLNGVMWVVKGAPGTAEYARFYKGAAEKGWIFSDPRAAKGMPGQAKAMAEMYKKLAEIGGVPYQMDITMKMSGEGPLAMLARSRGMATTMTVESIETAGVSDDLFAPPTGYKLNQKK
jgi:hypothetical protein